MLKLVLIQTLNSVLGGVSLLGGPLVAALWTVVGEWIISPLVQRAKAGLPPDTNRANVNALRDTAFYVKMAVTNPAGLLSLLVVVTVVKTTVTTKVSRSVDVWVTAASAVVLLPALCATPLALFPLMTAAWLVIKDRYEWTGKGRALTFAVPFLKLGGAALFAEMLPSSHARTSEIPAYVELFPMVFVVECLLVTTAVLTGCKAQPHERSKTYLMRLAVVPLAVLKWSW